MAVAEDSGVPTGDSGGQHARPPTHRRDGVPQSAYGRDGVSACGRDGVSPSASTSGNMPALPRRKRPAHGVFIDLGTPTIVFLTVCTEHRTPWLTNPATHSALINVWTKADAWNVGYYLLMPDHLHLFCSPHKLEFTLKAWVSHWKRKFSCLHLPETGQWQRDFWDTRLKYGENYHEKWEYVRQNPARKRLVENSDNWPYQGVLNDLRW